MQKPETKFQNQIQNSIEFLFPGQSFWRKLPDVRYSIGGRLFTLKKPFDAIAIIQGQAYAFEFKFQRGHVGFTTSKVRPHQIEALDEFAAAGGKSIIIIQSLSNQHNFATILTTSQIKDVKTIPFVELKKLAIYREKTEIKGKKKLVWDLTVLGQVETPNLLFKTG